MPADDHPLDEVADAILDGIPVDWTALERQGHPLARPLIERLRVLAALADVHRDAPHVALTEDEQHDQLTTFTWGHLTVVELIGRGAFGEVYRARDTRLDRDVALKLVPADSAARQTRASSIIEEGRLLAQVRHPNVVTIHGAERIGDQVGLWMEFVEGRTLEQILESSGCLAVTEVVRIGVQLCHAINAVHEAGLLHRDIKSHNVMLADDGRVVLMDFGTGWEIKDKSGAAPAGTPLYLAPELLDGKGPTVRTDIYALGVLLYHLLTGVYPIAAEGIQELRAKHERNDRLDLRRLRPELPRQLVSVIERAIDPRPERRYDSGLAMATELQAPHPRVSRSWWAAFFTFVLVVAVLIAVTTPRRANRPSPTSPFRPAPTVAITPVTSTPGTKTQPAISRDGRRVAFAWWNAGEESEIYVKDLVTNVTTQVTRTKGGENYPAWSPDGRFLAFWRLSLNDADERVNAVRIIPAGGGQERSAWQPAAGLLGPGLDWSPDGRQLAVSARTAIGEPLRLALLDVASLEKRWITIPPPGSVGDTRPVFSPDSKSLAFVRNTGSETAFHVLQLATASLSRLPVRTHDIRGLTWGDDGRTLIFTSHQGGARDRLWRISTAGGEAEPVPGIGEGASFPSVTPNGNRMVFLQQFLDSNLYRVELVAERGAFPRHLAASTRAESSPDISPDGSRIAFASNRTGSFEIWLTDADGGNPTQLTDLHTLAGFPRWSPDGRRIVFSARPSAADRSSIYVADVFTGATNRITSEASSDQWPTWSADGKSIYFVSDAGGTMQIWRVPTAGGDPIQITRDGGIKAWESSDGRFLYYSNQTRAIWRMPATGGQPTLVLPLPENTAAWGGEWVLTKAGIYWLNSSSPRPAVEFFEFATGRSMPLITPAGPYHYGSGFSVSKDGRWLVFSQRDYHGSDIMMIEGSVGAVLSDR